MVFSRWAPLIAGVVLCLSAKSWAQSNGSTWRANPIPALAQQPVNFENRDVTLAGTLYMPDHGDRVPAVIVLWGAQAPTREFAMYQQLATGLPAIGVAVLLFDRRGSGQSGGSNEHSTFQDLAGDGIAALHALQHNPHIDPKRIGFWGLSQGGWLAILAASETPDAAFAISCSAPLVTPADQMTFAVSNLFTVRGYGTDALRQALALRHMEADYNAGHGAPYDSMVAATRQASTQRWYNDAFLRTVDEVPRTTPDTAWLRVMQYDPITPLEAVHVPLLIFYGGADPWVPVAASVERLRPIAARKPNISYYVIANADHTLSFPKKQTMDWDNASLEDEKPESTEYFFVMASWLTRRLALH
jgi:pimeloyl-ACP methyl ester carboxylesterase